MSPMQVGTKKRPLQDTTEVADAFVRAGTGFAISRSMHPRATSTPCASSTHRSCSDQFWQAHPLVTPQPTRAGDRLQRHGGYLGRRGDEPPGWKTLWRGWLHIQAVLEGVCHGVDLNDRANRDVDCSPSGE